MNEIKISDNKYFDKKKIFYPVVILLVTSFALLARLFLFDITSGDLNSAFIPWYDYIKAHGIYNSLKFGVLDANYSPIYMLILGFLTLIPVKAIYAIKMVAVIFDMVCAISAFYIVKEFKKGFYPLVTYCAVLLTPTLILNSSRWGQCDSIYTAFILLSVLAFLKNKKLLPGIFFGISIAFKMQAIFFLPAAIFIYLKKTKNPLVTFGSMAAGFLAINIFPVLFGSPVKDMLTVYLKQTAYSQSNTLTMGSFPNIYCLIQKATEMSNTALLFACGIMVLVFFILWEKIKFSPQNQNNMVLLITMFSLLLVPYVLPYMHERYYFPADVMSIIFGVVFIRYSIVPVFVILLSLFSYFPYLFGVTVINSGLMAVIMLGVIIALARGIYKGHFLKV